MNDLTHVFQEAWNKRRSWSRGRVWDILRPFTIRMEAAWIDWDENDEEWARIIENNEPVMFVSASLPLAIVLSPYRAFVDDIAKYPDLTLVEVDSFDKQTYSVDKRTLENIYGEKLSSNVAYDAMSINDLWWATV